LPTEAARDLHYADIAVNDTFSLRRSFSLTDGQTFASLSGDFNPLHLDATFGQASKFGKNIVHGMLVSSLFSGLIGMHLPGKKSLWVSQSLNFRSPIFWGDTVEARCTVTAKADGVSLITLRTEIFRDGQLLIDGTGRVQVLE
jgi:acyl dehydratase